jgi:hypothetical protein
VIAFLLENDNTSSSKNLPTLSENGPGSGPMLAKPQQGRVMNLEDAPEPYYETSFDGVGMPFLLLSNECSSSFSLLILTISEPVNVSLDS